MSIWDKIKHGIEEVAQDAQRAAENLGHNASQGIRSQTPEEMQRYSEWEQALQQRRLPNFVQNRMLRPVRDIFPGSVRPMPQNFFCSAVTGFSPSVW
jgi:hypothetical protein